MGQFILKALTGPVKGQTFPIRNGMKIGRSSGDIILKDNMVSELHAKIQIYSSGKIMILDQDSKNKIMINDVVTVKSVLEQGSRFQIGQTEFEVEFMQTHEEVMVKFITNNAKNIKNNPLSLLPFVQPIELIFLSGIQTGQKYYISYGPRFFGSNSVDFPIFENKAPKTAFTLVPNKAKTFFITKHPTLVRLNGKKINKASIQNKDKISIEGSMLQIIMKS